MPQNGELASRLQAEIEGSTNRESETWASSTHSPFIVFVQGS